MQIRRKLLALVACPLFVLAVAMLVLWLASYRYGGVYYRSFLRQNSSSYWVRQVGVNIGWGSIHVDEQFMDMPKPPVYTGEIRTREGRSIRRRATLQQMRWQTQLANLAAQVAQENHSQPPFYMARIKRNPWPVPNDATLGFYRQYKVISPQSHRLDVRLPFWMLTLPPALAGALFWLLRDWPRKAGYCRNAGTICLRVTRSVSGMWKGDKDNPRPRGVSRRLPALWL